MNKNRKDSFSSSDGSISNKSISNKPNKATKKSGQSKIQNMKTAAGVNAWPRDFIKSKVVLYCNMFDQNKSLVIHSADDNFRLCFGRELNFRSCLDDYVGLSTSQETFNEIKLSIQQGKSTCVSTNLYHSNGAAMACHISVTSIIGEKKYMMKSVSIDEDDDVNNAAAGLQSSSRLNNIQFPPDNNMFASTSISSIPMPSKSPISVIPSGYLGTRWAVITIRSAASVEQLHKNSTSSSTAGVDHDSGGMNQFDLIKSNCMQLMKSWSSSASTVIPISPSKSKRKNSSSSNQTSLQGTPVKKTKITHKSKVSPTVNDVQQQAGYKYYEGDLSMQTSANIMASPVKKSKNHQRKHPLQSRVNHQKSTDIMCRNINNDDDVSGKSKAIQQHQQAATLIDPKVYLATYLQSINSNASIASSSFDSIDKNNNQQQTGSSKSNMSAPVVPSYRSYPLSQFTKRLSCASALNNLHSVSSSDSSFSHLQTQHPHPILHSQSYDSYSCDQNYSPQARSPMPYDLSFFQSQSHNFHSFSSSADLQQQSHHDSYSFHSHYRDPFLPPSTAVMMTDDDHQPQYRCPVPLKRTVAATVSYDDYVQNDRDDNEVQYIIEKYSSPPRQQQLHHQQQEQPQQHIPPATHNYNNLIDNTVSSSHFIDNSFNVNNIPLQVNLSVYGNRNAFPAVANNNNQQQQGPRYTGSLFVPLSATTNTITSDSIGVLLHNNTANNNTHSAHLTMNQQHDNPHSLMSQNENYRHHHHGSSSAGHTNNNGNNPYTSSVSPGFMAMLNSFDWDIDEDNCDEDVVNGAVDASDQQSAKNHANEVDGTVEDDNDFNCCFTTHDMNNDDGNEGDSNHDLRSAVNENDENNHSTLPK